MEEGGRGGEPAEELRHTDEGGEVSDGDFRVFEVESHARAPDGVLENALKVGLEVDEFREVGFSGFAVVGGGDIVAEWDVEEGDTGDFADWEECCGDAGCEEVVCESYDHGEEVEDKEIGERLLDEAYCVGDDLANEAEDGGEYVCDGIGEE